MILGRVLENRTVIPRDEKLYARVKRDADDKFLAKTSVYKSAWIVREYKKRGGTYSSRDSTRDSTRDSKSQNGLENMKNSGLSRWFREKWVDLNRPGQPCGRPTTSKSKLKYPLCRPTRRVTSQTPMLADEIGRKELRRANDEKQKVRHKGRVSFGRSRKRSSWKRSSRKLSRKRSSRKIRSTATKTRKK